MATLNYKTMTIQDIIDWCKANNQVDWLKATASKMVDYKVYPRTKSAEGNVWKVDKTAEPTIEKRPITYIQIKNEFVQKFMPDIAPQSKPKKPSMYELIANL